MPVIREIGASLRALFTRLSTKSSTITGAETAYIDDAGTSLKATLANVIQYGGGSPRNATAGNATDYTYLLGAGDTYESPTDWVYTGIMTGIWDSATGAAQVTEI